MSRIYGQSFGSMTIDPVVSSDVDFTEAELRAELADVTAKLKKAGDAREAFCARLEAHGQRAPVGAGMKESALMLRQIMLRAALDALTDETRGADSADTAHEMATAYGGA